MTTEYKNFATEIRKEILNMIHLAKSSHCGSNLSIVDILTVLYGGILRVDPKNPDCPERDRFILSKGHACASVYAVLASKGFFPKEWLKKYYVDDAKLAGHITHSNVPGVEASTGSLGHGLPIGCGMALAAKRGHESWRTFVLLSDGELDEGSNWESILFASHHKLDNLTAIIDYNKIQSLTWVKDTINLEPLADKFHAFGWGVKEIDGHNYTQIERALTTIPTESEKPTCVIAHTTKGKGVSFMEDNNLWHYRAPDDEELRQALKEIGNLS